jgi:DNA-binding transcriptional LysR family regulator
MTPDRQLAAFAEGSLHLGFTRPLPAVGHQGLRAELVLQEALQAVVPETHPLARKKWAGLMDLSAYPFVLLDRNEATGLFDHIIAVCRTAGFSPSIVNAPNLMATVLTLVAAEQGISLVPESVRNLRSDSIAFLRACQKISVAIKTFLM